MHFAFIFKFRLLFSAFCDFTCPVKNSAVAVWRQQMFHGRRWSRNIQSLKSEVELLYISTTPGLVILESTHAFIFPKHMLRETYLLLGLYSVSLFLSVGCATVLYKIQALWLRLLKYWAPQILNDFCFLVQDTDSCVSSKLLSCVYFVGKDVSVKR